MVYPNTRKVVDIYHNEAEDFYSKDAREELLDEDELSPEEEAFMAGWEESDDYVED